MAKEMANYHETIQPRDLDSPQTQRDSYGGGARYLNLLLLKLYENESNIYYPPKF